MSCGKGVVTIARQVKGKVTIIQGESKVSAFFVTAWQGSCDYCQVSRHFLHSYNYTTKRIYPCITNREKVYSGVEVVPARRLKCLASSHPPAREKVYILE